jgi:hypothetical protein
MVANARLLQGAVRRKHRDTVSGLNELLNKLDPIGVADVVDDEYRSYAPHILSLLDRGANELAIAAELRQIVEERMGLSSNAQSEAQLANAIVAWHRALGPGR